MLALSVALAALVLPAAPPHPSPKGEARQAREAAPDRSGISWVEDDWPKARARALEAGQLVAVDVWATWCHSCLSMKHFALKDAVLAKAAKQHTWLALDYDRPGNAAFFAKVPVAGLPTFFVVDPKTETIVARWLGTGTAKQLAGFFEHAERSSTDPVVLGNRALAKDDASGARAIFERALEDKALDRGARSRLLGGWIEALGKLDPKQCAKLGVQHLAAVDDSASGLDFAAMVAGCAEALDGAEKAAVMTAVRDHLAPLVERGLPEIAVDDLSGLYATLTDIYDALGEPAAAERTVAARAKLLEDAVAKANTPAERATFDAHRLEVYLRLKRYAEADEMLRSSEREQPSDFNHPWRLAVLCLKQGGRTKDGLAAIDRALERGYGGRKLRLYSTKIDLELQAKDFEGAKKTVAEAEREIEKLPKAQVRPAWKKELDEKRARAAAGDQPR